MSKRTRWLGAVLLMGLLVMLLLGGMVAAQPAQPEPTAQQQTQDAIIQSFFQGTATAQAVQDATATLEAAFNTAQTATAQVGVAQTATLAAAFSAAQTATWQAQNPDFNVDNLEVVSVEEFPLMAGPGRTSAYLAPNGERFAHYDGDEICIYTISGVQERCVTLANPEGDLYGPTTERIRWSPDSRYLAMESMDFLRLFRDSDILVLDADEGTLTNVTDDGVDCAVILSQDEECAATYDLLPEWLPEGDALVFNRLSRVDSIWINTLYQVNIDGSGEERLGLLPVQVFSYALDVSADGQKLAFNYDVGDDRRNGLWVSDLDGRSADQIFRAEERFEIPYQITFSADGQFVLTADGRLGTFAPTSAPEDSPIRVSPVEGGEPRLLDTSGLVYGAGWSPYGSAMAYVIFDPQERGQEEPAVSGLYLTNRPGEPGRRVLPGIFVPPTTMSTQAITWAANNTILLTEPGQPRLFAVQLGEQ